MNVLCILALGCVELRSGCWVILCYSSCSLEVESSWVMLGMMHLYDANKTSNKGIKPQHYPCVGEIRCICLGLCWVMMCVLGYVGYDA